MSKLQWKMPTWKGVIGILGIAYTAVCQFAQIGGLSPAAKGVLVTVSGALLVAERVCDALDNQVAAQNPPASTPNTSPIYGPITPPPIVPTPARQVPPAN